MSCVWLLLSAEQQVGLGACLSCLRVMPGVNKVTTCRVSLCTHGLGSEYRSFVTHDRPTADLCVCVGLFAT
jgi:hypothetical protein